MEDRQLERANDLPFIAVYVALETRLSRAVTVNSASSYYIMSTTACVLYHEICSNHRYFKND